MKTTVELKSGFERGAKIIEVLGEFPNFEIAELDRAFECTRQGDENYTHLYEYDDKDGRRLFHRWYWGVTPHSFNSAAEPLTKGAWDLVDHIPASVKGWDLLEAGYCPAYDLREVEWARYILAVARATASTRSPAQKREHFEKRKSQAIETWNKAGLNGPAIWAGKVSWSREDAVVALASQLVGIAFPTGLNSHRLFEKIAGFPSPLSIPRTLSAIRMAEMSAGNSEGNVRVPFRTKPWLTIK